jgi:ribonuclease BN (tRNA processing enzyme)
MFAAALLALLLFLLTGCGSTPATTPRQSCPDGPAGPEVVAADPPTSGGDACREARLAVQVLGSGGPIPDDDRASSGYLVWQAGHARVLIDVGGGVFLRFGEAGARIEDLALVAVSHLHADHVADLPALLKGGYFADREASLPLVGPTGNERFPTMQAHVQALLDPASGAFRYLSGYLDGEGLFPLDVRMVDAASVEPKKVVGSEKLTLKAVGVHHGTVPALGFEVAIDGKRIAFSGDQSAKSTAFVKLAAGADLLVVHHALPESGFEGVTHLHRTPSQIGDLAAAADVGRLVLSHHMQRALRKSKEGLAAIRKRYPGPVDMADDLSCYVLLP